MSDLEGLKAFQIMLLFQEKVINKQIPPLKLRRCYIETMESLRRKNRPKEKETPVLSALKTKGLKVERRGGRGNVNPTPPKEFTRN